MIFQVILAIICAILYRLGGIGKPFNTKYRDIGCPLVCLVSILGYQVEVNWYIHAISFVLLFAALTTYWDNSKYGIKDKFAKVINWRYPEDNFYLHALFCGLAYLPYAIATGSLWGYILRCSVLCLLIGVWSDINKKDWLEEGGRGAILVATIPLMFI